VVSKVQARFLTERFTVVRTVIYGGFSP